MFDPELTEDCLQTLRELRLEPTPSNPDPVMYLLEVAMLKMRETSEGLEFLADQERIDPAAIRVLENIFPPYSQGQLRKMWAVLEGVDGLNMHLPMEERLQDFIEVWRLAL